MAITDGKILDRRITVKGLQDFYKKLQNSLVVNNSKGENPLNVHGTLTDIGTRVTNLEALKSTNLSFKVLTSVADLPDEDLSPNDDSGEGPQTNVIYLVPHAHSQGAENAAGASDSYDEYIFIYDEYEDDETHRTVYGKYELIGNTDIDLSAYIKTTTADGKYLAKGATAAAATKDAAGNVIATTYQKKSETAGVKVNNAGKADALNVTAAVGGTTVPVYIDSQGKPQAITSYGGKAATAGSADTATNLAAAPTLAAGTTNKNAIKVTAGGKISAEFTVPYATSAGSAGSATTAGTATNLAAAPSLASSGNTITVTAGGKTSAALTVPYATSAGSAGSASTAGTATNLAAAPTVKLTGTANADGSNTVTMTVTAGGKTSGSVTLYTTASEADITGIFG